MPRPRRRTQQSVLEPVENNASSLSQDEEEVEEKNATNSADSQKTGVLVDKGGKSAYELAREERLKSNKLKMMQLGLENTARELVGATKQAETEKRIEQSLHKIKTKKKPSRESKRVRGQGPDGGSMRSMSSKLSTEEEKAKFEKLQKLVQLYGKW